MTDDLGKEIKGFQEQREEMPELFERVQNHLL
jgi:hypothetical protein